MIEGPRHRRRSRRETSIFTGGAGSRRSRATRPDKWRLPGSRAGVVFIPPKAEWLAGDLDQEMRTTDFPWPARLTFSVLDVSSKRRCTFAALAICQAMVAMFGM